MLNSSLIPGFKFKEDSDKILEGTVFFIKSSKELQLILLSINLISSFLGPICLLAKVLRSIIYFLFLKILDIELKTLNH